MFYKKENDSVISAEIVATQGVTLTSDTYNEHIYPIDGWIWTDNINDAINYFANAGKNTITLRQAKLALLNAGKLNDTIAAIAALPEPDRTAAGIEFDYANEVERDSALLNTIALVIGLTEEELDDLFNQAKLL